MMNLFMFLAICFVAYFIFRKMNFVEGMTDASNSKDSTSTSSSSSGVAGKAASYAATIKAASVKLQDELLITKYRKDYETSILNLDELINNLMLQTALSIDDKNPYPTITKLSNLNQAKVSLNSVMKYVDSQ